MIVNVDQENGIYKWEGQYTETEESIKEFIENNNYLELVNIEDRVKNAIENRPPIVQKLDDHVFDLDIYNTEKEQKKKLC